MTKAEGLREQQARLYAKHGIYITWSCFYPHVITEEDGYPTELSNELPKRGEGRSTSIGWTASRGTTTSATGPAGTTSSPARSTTKATWASRGSGSRSAKVS